MASCRNRAPPGAGASQGREHTHVLQGRALQACLICEISSGLSGQGREHPRPSPTRGLGLEVQRAVAELLHAPFHLRGPGARAEAPGGLGASGAQAKVQEYGHLGLRLVRLGPWAFWPMGLWPLGPRPWGLGPLRSWALEPLGLGPWGSWAPGGPWSLGLGLLAWAAGAPGLLGPWALGPLVFWGAGPLGSLTLGRLGLWLGPWAPGPLGARAPKLRALGSWAPGLLGPCAPTALGAWCSWSPAPGPLGSWAFGVLARLGA